VGTFFGQGGRGFVSRGCPHFFSAKNFGFFETCDVSTVHTDKVRRGVGSVRTLWTRERGQVFAILCGRLLWAAP